jgi:cobalamin-dependent methionine synthase I
LKGTDYLVFGVVTIGNSLEDKISEFFTNKEYSRGLALDAVGTVAVRYLSRHVRSIICKEAKEQNLQTTKHFTPGTAEWDISQQKNIFEIIPADKIGVRLTESYMMIPKKSLSWVIGIGKESLSWVIGIGKEIIITSKENDSCKICLAENCQFRKTF